MGVLSGYRVLDCTIAMAGPFAGQRLGDLGADVVKVEPVTGEWQRHVAAGGARGNRINVSFLSDEPNRAAHGLYVVHFPAGGDNDLSAVQRGAIRLLGPIVRSQAVDTEWGEGFYPREGRRPRR